MQGFEQRISEWSRVNRPHFERRYLLINTSACWVWTYTEAVAPVMLKMV
jgi:hypothetical protein